MTTIVSLMIVVASGGLPAGIGAVLGITWVGDSPVGVSCMVLDGQAWECRSEANPDEGSAIFVGSEGVAIAPREQGRGRTLSSRWGRVVSLSGTAGELRGIRATGWRPERSTVRLNVTRFRIVPEPGITFTPIGRRRIWIAGGEVDPDAFVEIAVAGFSSIRIAVSALRAEPADSEYLAAAQAPATLTGTVSAGTDPQGGVEIELFERMPSRPASADPIERWTLIRTAAVTSSDDGQFVIDNLPPGQPYLVLASHPAKGRATIAVRDVTMPIAIRLRPPRRATGRVWRRSEPVEGARVRFVPSVATFVASADARELLTAEAATDVDGTFTLTIPEATDGEVQIIGPDGSARRIPVASGGADDRIAIGDIMLPDHRRLRVRLLDGDACSVMAVGPLGSLGLTTVQAEGVSGVYWLDLPEAGEWALGADCAGTAVAVTPGLVHVPPDGAETAVDVRVNRRNPW